MFIWAINESRRSGVSDWPGELQSFLMLAGPIILALHFVNAKTIITTILTPLGSEHDKMVDRQGEIDKVEIPKSTPILTEQDVALEREVLGHTAVLLKAIAGFISTHVICYCSLLFTSTIQDALLLGKPLPSDLELFLVVVGPIITSWSFVKAGSTLGAVVTGVNSIARFRRWTANIIDPGR